MLRYFCTIITERKPMFNEQGERATRDTRQHVECLNKKHAEDMADVLAVSQRKFGIRTEVSARMFKHDGGSIILSIEQWRDLATCFADIEAGSMAAE